MVQQQDSKTIGATTVQILLDTRDRLQRIGKKGDSWDDIIRRILDEYEVIHPIKDE